MLTSLSRLRIFALTRIMIMLSLVVLMVLLGARPAKAASTCTAFESITMGKYWINNNLWGQGSGSGWQCIWGSSSNGSTIGWGTNWNWAGQPNSVKSYASAVLGWHWGTQVANTGLPVQVSAGKNITSRWSFRLTQQNAGALNVSYDLWLHTISHPGANDTPSDEVMLWLSRSGGPHPVGNRQATLNIDGTTWDLYEGTSAWRVHTFVRTTDTTAQTVNLKDFLSTLVARGSLNSARYLNGIEVGTEVFTGSGQLDTIAYETNIH